MTRNSKSNNDGAVFTYYERHVAKLGGTRHQRLPGVSMKKWHHCALSLTTARDAVVTGEGVIYDREAILRHLVQQKQEQKKQDTKLREIGTRKRSENGEGSAVSAESKARSDGTAAQTGTAVAADGVGTTASLNFWLPGGRRAGHGGHKDGTKGGVGVVAMKACGKKAARTVCPTTGKPLRMRDLLTLSLTRSSSSTNNGIDNDADPFVCPVCLGVLNNASKPVALRTGTVLCTRCAQHFVTVRHSHTESKGARDPVTLEEINPAKDIIVIRNHGTGFAGSAADDLASKEASWYQPSMT